MSNNQKMPDRVSVCLKEAKQLMDRIVRELPASTKAKSFTDPLTYPVQSETVVELAGNLGADQFRSCMARQSPPKRGH